MRKLNKLLFVLSFILGLGLTTKAQEGVTYANSNSVNPIPYYEQLYKQRIWTRVDLKQKQNKGFFNKNREFTKILIDAVMNDEIQTVYNAEPGYGELDSLLTKEGFEKRLQKTEDVIAEEQMLWEEDYGYFTEEVVEYNGVNYSSKIDNNLAIPGVDADAWGLWAGDVAESYLASEITMIEVMEDVIFDKRRAREYRDIISIKLIVTANLSNDGTNYYVATFAFKDLEKFFKEHPEKAIWYNQYNSAENRNLADAFALRLFQGQLYKIDNAEDLTILDIYGENPETGQMSNKAGLIGAEYLKMKMLEREHNLWSY